MTPDQYNSITNTLATLVEGTRDINDHLARLNSKVATHEGEINTLTLWKARAEGFGGAIKLGWGTVVTLASGAFALFVYWTTQK